MKLISAKCSVALATALLISFPAWSGPDGPGRDRVGPSVAQTGSETVPALGWGGIEQPKVLGLTYGEWAAKWVAWSEAGPIGQNAIEDTTGAFCGANQPAGDIWFLAGTYVGVAPVKPVERHCTIPLGRALFYPIVESSWIDCPPPHRTEV